MQEVQMKLESPDIPQKPIPEPQAKAPTPKNEPKKRQADKNIPVAGGSEVHPAVCFYDIPRAGLNDVGLDVDGGMRGWVT